MEKYEQIAIVGEGSYGIVMKCRHRDTDQIVAIKKFLETEEDATIRRMALREIRMLKRLRHENLVTMIEVFRHRKRFYLVFEYMEGTVLDELEKNPEGLDPQLTRECIYQVLRAVHYCHLNQIIHRDVKPENVLVSSHGVVKLCDFGFARLVGSTNDPYTEYVATRWYRAPELLVGETYYGAPVDIWAIGCLFSEMMTGEPLFPGDSDIDQLYLIVKLIGKPSIRQQQLMTKNSHLRAIKRSSLETANLYKLFPTWPLYAVDFLIACMKMDPNDRPKADDLLKHNFFVHDRFTDKFLPALREKVRKEFNENPLLRKYKVDILMSTDSKERREELKPKRNLAPDVPRWRINLIQESMKRKLLSEQNHPEQHEAKTINLNMSKSNQKLVPVNKLNPISKQALKRDEKLAPANELFVNKHTNNSNNYLIPKVYQDATKVNNGSQKENPRLEKALDLLSKINQKNNLRPKSTNKEVHQFNNTLSTSPPEFQSLQSQSFREASKSPMQHAVLHPNITNISFNKEAKKSPYTIQNLNASMHKQLFSSSQNLNPQKTHHLKRLDRPIIVDTTVLNTERSTRFKSPPEWLSSIGMPQNRKESWKNKDEFTLPTVPGATGSPSKTKKKQTAEYARDSRMPTPMHKTLRELYRTLNSQVQIAQRFVSVPK